ncbi:MAG: ABC transporter permease [Gloeomargarita sp. HHBFW_bins_162]
MALSNSSLQAMQTGQKPTTTDLQPTVFWRLAERIPGALHWRLTVVSILAPLLVWWGVTQTPWVDPRFLPSPMQVLQAMGRLWQEGFLLRDTLASGFRVVAGFFLAGVVATPIGIGMGAFASIRTLLEPLIGLLRYMPAAAFIPLLIIYFGLDEAPKIILIFLGTVFFNVLMIMDAVKFVPKELIEVTYTLGGNRWQVLLKVITPYIVPSILDTLRVNIATSWNLVVIAELIAANEGLGKRIQLAQRFFRTDEIFACLLILGLIGVVIDVGMRYFTRFTCRWAFSKSGG